MRLALALQALALAPLAPDHRPQIEAVDVEVAWAAGAAAEWEGHLCHCDQHVAAEAAPSPRLRAHGQTATRPPSSPTVVQSFSRLVKPVQLVPRLHCHLDCDHPVHTPGCVT